MEVRQLDILLRLVIAHLLADFVFQTNLVAKEKKNGLASKYFYFHLLIVGALTYLLLPGWNNIMGPIAVMLIHGLIDWGKSRIKKDTTWLFVMDQTLHLLTLLVYWIIITNNTFGDTLRAMAAMTFQTKSLIIIAAYLESVHNVCEIQKIECFCLSTHPFAPPRRGILGIQFFLIY
jgi:hypothetical protein